MALALVLCCLSLVSYGVFHSYEQRFHPKLSNLWHLQDRWSRVKPQRVAVHLGLADAIYTVLPQDRLAAV